MKKVWQGCEVSKYQGYLQHKIKPVVRDKGKWGAQSKTWNKCGRGASVLPHHHTPPPRLQQQLPSLHVPPPAKDAATAAGHRQSPKVATTLAPRSVKVADNDAKPYQKRRRPPAVLQGSRTSSHASHTGFGSYATKPYCLASTVIRAAITQPVRTPTRRRQCRQQSLFFSALLFYYGGFVQVQDESDNGGIERR
ncbi:hypothetical protein DEO72_LG4g652 [Vigna unguiculata]|uniref:Uncharacterized protein n=1 Tax=Vigna unguiculata TaxID=3917 RepID=A0A4D6LNA8_VIGUN|nr:hypothetical protein DEO72_LG4g652 [Vigna unguiculata]